MLLYQTTSARGQRFHKQVVALRRLRLWVQDREIGREIGSPRASVLLSFSAPDRAQLAGHRPADATIGPLRATLAAVAECAAPHGTRPSVRTRRLGTSRVRFRARQVIARLCAKIAQATRLALQLHFRFEMGAACFGLVSSSPE